MARENDPKWADLQKKLLEAMKTSDWGEMAQLYYQQATIVRKEGKEAKHLIAEGIRCELTRMEKADVRKIKILGAQDEMSCPACAALNKKIISVAEALQTMPVPNLSCTANIPGVAKNWCRCTIGAVIER